ncbi:MAG: hypothetical protein CR968_00440 [Flavobacteriia bacterium]|nr:MAG: hypothetical protein CR968_00440 [Flavobacteriia bacterium]
MVNTMSKKIILIVILGLVVLNCKNQISGEMNLTKKTKKFDWLPTECAPKPYPVEVNYGSFSLDGEIVAFIPSGGRTVKNGWGKIGSTYLVGEDFKLVPNHLDIIWISFAENQFYKGSFELPKEKMLELFEKGFINRLGKQETYSRIVCGMAPGGVVAVWLLGAGKTVEITHFKAEKTDMSMEEFNPSGIQDRDKYVKDRINSLDDKAKEYLKREGITYGRWTEYRKRYHWKPVFKQITERDFTSVLIDYVNGENIYTVGSNPELKQYNALALPKYAKLYWQDSNKNQFGCKIYFDESEVKKAFEKINQQSTNKELDLVFNVDKYNSEMKIYLKSNEDEVLLEKTKVKIFETVN